MLSDRLKNFGRKPLCNLKAERAPRIFGFVFPLCYRCLGLLVGAIFSLFIKLSIFISILFMLPMVLDFGLQYLKILPSTNIRRLLTGLLFGLSLGVF